MIKELFEKISKYGTEELVFWVGAGIDNNTPSCLPLGNELTKTLLEQACGKKYTERILQNWRKSQETFRKIMDENVYLSGIPRLETVLEGFRIFEKDELQNQYSVIHGLESFQETPPNYCHYMLAALLHLGANIVTTNYDICIQKAYKNLYFEDGYELYEEQREGIYTFRSDFAGSGQLYYIHGIATDIAKIGATLSTVKVPLKQQFVETLRGWIQKKHCFVFLGYGGGDYLDVNPFFQSISRNNTSMGTYVRHGFDDKMEIMDPWSNEKTLTGCFAENYTVKAQTEHFVEELSELFSVRIAKEDIKEEEKFCWVDRLEKRIRPYPEQFREASILATLFLLGINPEEVFNEGWTKRLLSLMDPEGTNQYLGYYGFQNCVRANRQEDIQHFYVHINKTALARSDKWVADKKYGWAVTEWLQFYKYRKHMLKALDSKEIVGWDCITPLNHIGKMILTVYVYSSHMFFQVFKVLYRKKLLDLWDLWKRFSEAGAQYTVELDEINVAYINLGVIELLIYDRKEEALRYILQAKNNYMEGSSLQGVINSLLYQVIYYGVVGAEQENTELLEQGHQLLRKTDEVIAREQMTEQKRFLRNLAAKLV